MADRTNIALPLTAPDLDRLGRFLRLLGSEHVGERAAAGMKADALIRERGASWMQITDALKLRVEAPPQQPRPEPKPEPAWKREPQARANHRSQTSGWINDPVKFCLMHSELLTASERDFMRGVDGRRTLTSKQMEVVESVQRRIKARLEEQRERERAANGGGSFDGVDF